MPLLSRSPSISCTRGGSINVMQLLRNASAPLLPGALHSVLNAPVGARRPPPRGAEPAVLVDAASRELIAWGTASGCGRLLQLGDRLLPGLSISWTAWRTFSALSEAARGNMARSLQQFPFTALAPAPLLDALASCLSPWIPDVLVRGPDHQDLVLALALLALVYDMTRQGPRAAPDSARTQAARTTIARLRAALSVLGGLRCIVNRSAPGTRRLALAGPSTHSAAPAPSTARNQTSATGPTQWLAQVFPGASQHLQADIASTPVSFAGGWLPGAAAARKGKAARPVRPAAPQKAPAAKRLPALPARRNAHRDSLAAPAQRPRHPALKPTGVGVHASAHAGDYKETMMSPVNSGSSNSGRKTGARADVRRTTAGRPRDVDDTDAGSEENLSAAEGKSAGRHASKRPLDRLRAASMTSTAGLPSCLHFHHAAEAKRQVVDARFQHAAARFCVHRSATSLFRRQFDTARIDVDQDGGWVVSGLLHEQLPTPLRTMAIRRFSCLGSIDRHEVGAPAPLADDQIYVVPTISAVPSGQLEGHGIAGDRILPKNGFKLVRHLQLDGTWRTFIAYFINRSSGQHTGSQAGFVEIESTANGLAVHDPRTGFSFSSDTLDDLVAGIEIVSGCQFRPDADELPALRRPTRGRLPHTDAMNLFVRRAALAKATPPYSRQPFNPGLDFFDAVRFQFRDGLITGLLFRRCFTLIGNSVVFVDRDGQLGTLRFSTSRRGYCTLQPHDRFEAQLIREHGLAEGQDYRMEEVAEILENYGMSRLPLDTETPRPAAPRLDNFHMARRGPPAPGAPAPAPQHPPEGN